MLFLGSIYFKNFKYLYFNMLKVVKKWKPKLKTINESYTMIKIKDKKKKPKENNKKKLVMNELAQECFEF